MNMPRNDPGPAHHDADSAATVVKLNTPEHDCNVVDECAIDDSWEDRDKSCSARLDKKQSHLRFNSGEPLGANRAAKQSTNHGELALPSPIEGPSRTPQTLDKRMERNPIPTPSPRTNHQQIFLQEMTSSLHRHIIRDHNASNHTVQAWQDRKDRWHAGKRSSDEEDQKKNKAPWEDREWVPQLW